MPSTVAKVKSEVGLQHIVSERGSMLPYHSQKLLELLCLATALIANTAHGDVEGSLSTDLEKDSYSSLLSMSASKKGELLQLDSEVSIDYAASYAKAQNANDSQSAKASLTLTQGWNPLLGVSASNSVREKTSTLGANTGFKIAIRPSGYSFSWAPGASLKQTTIKVSTNNTKKAQKKGNPSLLQYGLTQSLTVSDSKLNSATLFYNIYRYNIDIAEVTDQLNTLGQATKQKKSFGLLTDQLSTFAASLWGLTLTYNISPEFEAKADFYSTQIQRDKSVSELLMTKATYTLTEKVDLYLQGDFSFSQVGTRKYTLGLPFNWSDSLSTEIGIARSESVNTNTTSASDKAWSVLLALTYGIESDAEVKSESQSR